MSVSFFFAMAWKSALISGVALALTVALRSRAAAERTLLLRISICLLLLLPLAAVLMPALKLPIAAAAGQLPPLLLGQQAAAMQAAGAAAAIAAPTIWDDPSELVLLLYLGGFAMIASRFAAGLWTLRRWTREAEPVLGSDWTEALDRVRGDRAQVRLLVSPECESPLSWGWRRPVILIDRDSHAMPEEAASILAHEMAHVARGDWLTLLLARTAVALFWFNPLVWLMERIVMEDAEQAADRRAIATVEPMRYAQTLLNYAALGKGNPMPANSIASGSLARRVRAILDGNLSTAPRTSLWTLTAIGASVLTAAPVGALQLVAPDAKCETAGRPSGVGLAVAAPRAAAAPVLLAEAAIAIPPAAPAVPAVVTVARAADGTPRVPPVPAVPPTPPVPATPAVPATPVVPRAPTAPGFAVLALPSVHAAFATASFATPATVVWHGDWDGVQVKLAGSDFAPLDPEAIQRLTERAMASADRQARLAMEMAERQGRMAAEQAARNAALGQKLAARNFALSMEQGAQGLERGAEGMERGAQRMSDEAQRLHDRDYRQRKIAEAALRGKTLTHETLLATAEGLEDGASDMRESARDMREQAEELRRECLESDQDA